MGMLREFTVTITRPANTTAYAANDVIGDVSGSLSKILNAVKQVGYPAVIRSILAVTNDTGLAGKTVELFALKNAVTAIADNAAFTLSAANWLNVKGTATLVFGTGIKATLAENKYCDIDIFPADKNIGIIPVTIEGFTPSANSTYIELKISVYFTNA